MAELDCSPEAMAALKTRMEERAKLAAHREAVYYANVVRAAKLLTDLAKAIKADEKNPLSFNYETEWAELECFEALECAFDLDLSDRLDDLRQELGIDAEGYQTNDEGDSTDFRLHTPLRNCKV